MKNMTTNGVLLVMVFLVSLYPEETRAGDKEWAAAGKILAGFTAAHVVSDILGADHNVDVKFSSHTNYCPPRKARLRKRYNKYSNGRCDIGWKKPNRFRKRVAYKEVRKSAYSCDDPIIVFIEKGRRIYQPRIRGAKAYLQIYSSACNQWVSIEDYPSIW